MSNKPTLDEVLNDFRQNSIIIHSNNSLGGGESGRETFVRSLDEAKQQLTQLIADIIDAGKVVGDSRGEENIGLILSTVSVTTKKQRQRAKEQGIDL